MYIWPVRAFADGPWFDGPNGEPGFHWGMRSLAAMRMQLQAKNFIQRTYPYWNRTHGRDHIFQVRIPL
jgi:hypothetical protein